MSDIRRRLLLNSLKLLDLLMMVGSFALATVPVLYENQGVTFSDFLSMRVKVQNFLLFLGILLVWHVIFSMLGLYEPGRAVGERKELVNALEASFVGSVFLGVTGAIAQVRMVDMVFLLAFWLSSSALVVLTRVCIRFVLQKAQKRENHLLNVLIIGTNARAVEVARKIESRPQSGYRVMGFADEPWEGLDGFQMDSYPLVCGLKDLAEFFRKVAIDEVVMALPLKSFYFEASRIASVCEEQGIVMSVIPSIFNLRTARSRAEDFEGESVVTLYTGQLSGWPAITKRTLDIIFSLMILLVLAPVFLVTSLLIKIFSPGPVFFTQERLGLNKHRFRICKFRTMVPNAEQAQIEVESLNEAAGPVFKIKNDPRITSLGRFLRKTSIDELPQLFNVLKGDMSLVGPRPLPVRDYEGFDQDWHRRRFTVRPGITCLWQVKGRSSIPFEQWMELDMQYIDHWSIWLDLKILVDTIPAVLKGSGAA